MSKIDKTQINGSVQHKITGRIDDAKLGLETLFKTSTQIYRT